MTPDLDSSILRYWSVPGLSRAFTRRGVLIARHRPARQFPISDQTRVITVPVTSLAWLVRALANGTSVGRGLHRPCRARPADRSLVAEDRSAAGVRDQTRPEPAVHAGYTRSR